MPGVLGKREVMAAGVYRRWRYAPDRAWTEPVYGASAYAAGSQTGSAIPVCGRLPQGCGVAANLPIELVSVPCGGDVLGEFSRKNSF